MQGFTRREFLAGSGAAAGAFLLGCPPLQLLEGIYTDRFTYRHGEDIQVHLGLLDAPEVEVRFTRRDVNPAQVPILTVVNVQAPGPLGSAGMLGANYPSVLTVPASSLAPGFYEVSVPQGSLRPENQTNTWSRKPTNNWYAHFVVSDAVPGSRSRILWIHDSLSSVAYGTFGGQSIYGDGELGKQLPWVSWLRPSLTRQNDQLWRPLRRLQELGFEAELIDLLQLAQEPPDFLEDYDLVLVIGKFEYVPHDFLDRLARFRDGGGNIVVAATEFGIFRCRLDTAFSQLQTYKARFAVTDHLPGPDPVYAQDPSSDQVAGVGMNMAGSYFETEVIGASMWACWKMDRTTDFDLYHVDEIGWLLENTGLGAGDGLPTPVGEGAFALGNLIDFDGSNQPFVLDSPLTRTPLDTVVWAAVPNSQGVAWWLGVDEPKQGLWPNFDSHAVCTYQVSGPGGQVIQLPSRRSLDAHLGQPIYLQIFENLLERLSERA